MGDLPPGSRPQGLDTTATGFARDGNQGLALSSLSPLKSPENNAPFYSQLSTLPQQPPRPDFRTSANTSTQYNSQEHGASLLNMASMVGALPDYASVDDASLNLTQHPTTRSLAGASMSAMAYPPGQNIHTPAHASGSMPGQSSYGTGYSTSPYSQAFVPSQVSQHAVYPHYANQPRMPGGPSMQMPYQNYPQASQYMYYAAPYGAQGQFAHGFSSQGAQGQGVYEKRGSTTGVLAGQQEEVTHHSSAFAGTHIGGGNLYGDGAQRQFAPDFPTQSAGVALVSGIPRPGPVSSIPRGPPRKPKQSGHALWVGNLPPGTTVVALKDHFSREATKDIESLFLISKSNCAFVNYRTEASCTAAMHRFHDSRFNGVRLVCRLRRSSAPASGVPTGPSAMVRNQQASASPPKTPRLDKEAADGLQDGLTESLPEKGAEETIGSINSSSKYFIVKSLTLQDLELSVRNGIWATQSHNEDVLNKAFRSTENVYLIFSANKSGEYFGYARMVSPILEDGSRLVDSAPKPEAIVDAPDVPRSIPTPATEWAPRGKIIDDSARGTIFWEAELSESEGEEVTAVTTEKAHAQVDGDTSPVAQSWGKPFKIEWISTNRLPFYRTRGLRNPWNANREVKIARDGTELEPSVGERLIQMFHRLGPSNAGVGAPMMPLHAQSFGVPGMLSQMRPY